MMERAQNILSTWISKKSAGILIFLWSFVLAVCLSSFFHIPPLVSLILFVLALGLKLLGRSRASVVTSIGILAFGLGVLRYDVKDFHELQTPTNTGVVASEPEVKGTLEKFVVQTSNGENVLVSTDRFTSVNYGDEVALEGKFERPGVIEDFDYGAYLAKDDVYWTISYAKVALLAETTSPAHGQASGKSLSMLSRLVLMLIQIKHIFISKINQILPEPESSLLAGLLVAGKNVLPQTILDDFQHAGVIHIVVLSGYNVTIIAEFFLVALGFLGKRRAALFSALGIIAFALMTGATATVMRAAIMVLALLLGQIIGRPYHAGRILLFTATLMLFWNPKYLIFDPSFELSFLAMLALVYVVPIVKMLAEKISPALGQASGKSRSISSLLAEVIFVTIATQITVFPFLMYSVGNVSSVALFSNILILFFVPYTMLIGFVAVLLAFVSPYLALPLTFISHLLLYYILAVAHFFGNLSFASIAVSISGLTMILIYLFLISIFIYTKQRTATGGSDPLIV
jgi:competence protein ComEC